MPRSGRSRWQRVVLAALVAASWVAACGGDLPGESRSGEVVLYTSMPDPVVARLQGVIERRFPDLEGNYWVPLGEGITLRVVRGRTGDIERLIADELAAGELEADVIWLAEPSSYETYKDMGLLARYAPPEDAPIPSSYVDPDGYYVAGRVIGMALGWNTSSLPEGLTDWPDLADVEPAAFPSPESGAARATISALRQTYGDGFFVDLEDHGAVSVPSNGAARDGVVAGTFEGVAVLDYMMREAIAAGRAVDYAYPESGTVLIPSPLAITADAPNPGAADVFVDFILSRSGQEIVVQIGSFYPVRTDVAPPAGAPALADIATLRVDWRELGAEADAIGSFWDGVFGSPAAP